MNEKRTLGYGVGKTTLRYSIHLLLLYLLNSLHIGRYSFNQKVERRTDAAILTMILSHIDFREVWVTSRQNSTLVSSECTPVKTMSTERWENEILIPERSVKRRQKELNRN